MNPLIKINTFQASFPLFLIAAKPDELSECVCACARRHVTFTLHQANCLGSLLTAVVPLPLRLGKKPVLCNSIKGRLSLVSTKNIKWAPTGSGCIQSHMSLLFNCFFLEWIRAGF